MKLINELMEGDEEAWRFRSVGQEDPDDRIVLVQGLGKYTVGQIRKKVKDMVADIARETAKDQVNWNGVKWKMNHGALHAFIETLANLEEKE